ncbi:MAG: hypothetical protein M1816_002326 [Peltula sp. TS41687]|nr:MAG: hypothetical protein M1816_002326 [Peltula sp. TS41687]
MADQQKAGGHYSGANPVPTIRKFLDNLDSDKKDRDRLIDEQQKQQKQGGIKPHRSTESGKLGKTTKVTDPVTGGEAQIADIKIDPKEAVDNPTLTVPNANLGRPAPVKTDAHQPLAEYREKQDITSPPEPTHPNSTADVPITDSKTNILFHPTPSVNFEPAFASLESRATLLTVCIFAAIVLLGRMFGASLLGLVPTAACVSSGVFLWMKEVIRSGRELEWESEKKRGETATANLIPESVEWLNTFLGVFWGLINPDMFQGVADTLEDVMQASVPGIIENVRVADINQGINAPRILSLRALPDAHVKELKKSIHEEQKKTKESEQLKAEEEGGDYYNLEVSLAYHAAPSGASVSSKARNMHMQLVFYLGIRGFFGVPLPIWVELQGLVATARIRLLMSPEPPFMKNLTFTLMGTPKVQAGCIPMVEKGVNVLNLPLISNFVNYAIGAAASMYVAPKSMTIDVGAILSGDTVQKETEAIGILFIRIHKAVGLSKQDKRGSEGGGSDPYITISFSKYGKPMYCTRVITDELNPIWEETAAILVTPDIIKVDEQLSVELWDSDRSTADDIVGKVELSMQKMIQHPGKMHPEVSKLSGMEAGSEMPGVLHWEVGYFSKPSFRPGLRTDGKNPSLPEHLKDKPEFQDDKGNLDSPEADAVAHTPPDPLWPTGICSVVIHQIVNLELENIKGSQGNRQGREYQPAKEAGEIKQEEGGKLPSSYCTILFNDQLVYRTRTKVVSSKPIFNAGTERFLRDWRSAIVTVTVRDQRMREHDPILGVVPLKLSDILQTSSQVTRWYPLDGGVGFGRVQISLLFRSVETKLPPNMLGWDVGTFEFVSKKILALDYTSNVKMKLRTGGSTGKLPRSHCKKLAEGDGIYWNVDQTDGQSSLRLPVKFRYRSPVVIEFHTASKRKADAYAVFWLQHLTDNEVTDINIPIWKTSNGPRLTQNYVTEENLDSLRSLPGYADVTEVGRLHFRGRFKPGLDESHQPFISDNDSRETYETWEACKAEGVRGRKVHVEIPEKLQQLHEQSLVEGRDTLKQAPTEEKKKWMAKNGEDWSGAFGEDPAQYLPSGRASSYDASTAVDGEGSDDDDNSSSSSDLGIHDADYSSGANGTAQDGHKEEGAGIESEKERKRGLHRKHRGLMQWKPVRSAVFAKDEALVAIRRARKKMTGDLSGREPDVETEIN